MTCFEECQKHRKFPLQISNFNPQNMKYFGVFPTITASLTEKEARRGAVCPSPQMQLLSIRQSNTSQLTQTATLIQSSCLITILLLLITE